jgi:hypothetical protein
MKGLIFDDFTVRIFSVIYMQSEGFKKDVYLFENIKNLGSDKINTLVGIFLLHPSNESLKSLKVLLKTPIFKEYHVCKSGLTADFTSSVDDDVINSLAQNDEFDVIKRIQVNLDLQKEIPVEFISLTPEMMVSGLQSTFQLSRPRNEWGEVEELLIEKMANSITSTMLALRKRCNIRYLTRSEPSFKVADSVNVASLSQSRS